MQSTSDHRAGLLFALAGFALLSTGDAIIKTMSGEWPPVAVAALRFVIGATALSALLVVRQGPRALRPANPWLQAGRGICLGAASLLFFSAIFVMPLAETTALIFVAPIFTSLLSRPLLGETVRPAVWIASAIAMVGVAIVLRPNLAEVGWYALLPLASALFMSLVMIGNRASAGTGTPLAMQAYIALGAAAMLLLAALIAQVSGIEALEAGMPAWHVVARCAMVAVTASTAHWLVYLGTTRAGAATIAPMTYIQLLVASIMGWLLFDEVPDALTWLGAAIIVAAGLYLWRDGRELTSSRNR